MLLDNKGQDLVISNSITLKKKKNPNFYEMKNSSKLKQICEAF